MKPKNVVDDLCLKGNYNQLMISQTKICNSNYCAYICVVTKENDYENKWKDTAWIGV